ncbi:O-antigen ligase family protein [Adhaeribacter soli]|nr:O-antigen ligase family protein [Adhaeribacter soli]
MPVKEKILLALISLFFLTLFFSELTTINVIITGALTVFCFTWNTFREKVQLLKTRKFISVMLLFFSWEVISVLLSDNTGRGLHYLKLHLPLLLLPLSVGSIALRPLLKERILLSFAVITSIVCLLCLLFNIYEFSIQPRSDIFYNDNLVQLLGRQSIYIALTVNFAIFIFAYFIVFRKVSYKPIMVLAIAFLYLFSYLLASRINLAVLLTATFGFSFYYIFSRKKLLEGMALVMGLLIGSFLIAKFFPNTLNRYKELGYSQFQFENQGAESHFNVQIDSTQWNGANFRLAAWTCGWEIFTANPLTGVHLGDKEAHLLKKYQEKNFHFAIKTDKNVHSTYLDILFSLGLTGLLLFVTGWLLMPLAFALKQQDYLTALMLLSFGIALVTEVYLSRTFGAMALGFFVPFLLSGSGKHIGPQMRPDRVIQKEPGVEQIA